MSELEDRLRAAVAKYKSMTPEEKRAQAEAQRQSWARAFAPAGSELSIPAIRERIAIVEKQISDATCWGAALSELGEELSELQSQLAIRCRDAGRERVR